MTTTAAGQRVELDIDGMTCASCASLIERKLNKLDGVRASVNFATERATVTHPDAVTVEQLVSTVVAAGYQASLPAPEPADGERHTGDLRRRFLAAAALTVPVLVLSMVPPTQFGYWQWVALGLTTPVVLWAAWPFHRATLAYLRHATTTMDTLVSLAITV